MKRTKQLKAIATDLTTVPQSAYPDLSPKVALMCINTYVGTRYNLGDGPLNDGYYISKTLKERGYTIYFILNAKKATFLNLLKHFLQNANFEVVVFYVGHGTNVRDLSGDEADGYDEALVFVDGNIIDDILLDHLAQFKNPSSKLLLLTDACHSGSIWDLQSAIEHRKQIPPNIISISAANDKQTAKQTFIDREDQGIFSNNFRKIVKDVPLITPNEIKSRITPFLRKYGQTVTIAESSPGLSNQPLFSF